MLVNTNNGLEWQNKLFKYTFLEKKKDNALSSVITIHISDFLPRMMLKRVIIIQFTSILLCLTSRNGT